MDTNTDPVTAVQELFSTRGPHTAESVVAAAQVIAEMWRYLGHATNHTREVLANPADAQLVFGALASADRRSTEVLDRLSIYARNLGDESTYTDRFAHDDPDGTTDQIQSTGHTAAFWLADAANQHRPAASRLEAAADLFSHLYRTQDDDEL
jgi:hypothetical protein